MEFVFLKFRLGNQLDGLFRRPDDAIKSRLVVSDEPERGIFIDKPLLARRDDRRGPAWPRNYSLSGRWCWESHCNGSRTRGSSWCSGRKHCRPAPESEETVESATLYQILRHGRETTKLGIFRNEIS